MKPKFTVIIPVYNGAAFIRQAVDCVLRQDYPAHEILIVDDGSTDRTPEILAAYGQKIRVLRIPNGGVSNARNTALTHVTGDHIAFLDADDIWLRTKLSQFAEAFERHPEVGLIFGNYVVRVAIFGNRLVRHYSGLRTRSFLNFDAPLKINPFKALLIENFTGTPSAAAVKKSVADQVGLFSDSHRPSEDYEYWLRCAALTRVALLSEISMYKRTHGANLSLDKLKTGRSHRKVLTDARTTCDAYLRQHPDLETVRQEALAFENYSLGHLAYAAGKKTEAFEYFREGLNARPSIGNFIQYSTIVSKKKLRSALASVGIRRTASTSQGV